MTDKEKTYGRKVVRGAAKKKQMDAAKKLLFLMIICALIGAVIGSIITGIAVHKADLKKMNRITISASETEAILTSLHGEGDNRIEKTTEFVWNNSDSLFGSEEFIPLDVPMDKDLQEFVFYISKAYNLDWTLVMAMIEHESSFRPEVVSETHDYGLMQINQSNHQWLSSNLGVTDFLDERQNIRCGVFVLNQLFERYDDTHKVLMAYNMGENGASKLWSNGVYSTPYSQDITEAQAKFQEYINQERNGDDNDN